MRKLQKLVLVLVLMLGLGLLVGCSCEEVKKLEDIQVSPAEATLNAGQIKELEVKPVPADVELPAVEFTSSDSTIASVGKDGKVLAVKAGQAEITVKAGGFTKKVTITVNPVLATDLQVSATLALEVGAKAAISYKISPQDATNKVPSFESMNPAVASVNAEGEVTGVAAGEAIIKVKADAIEKEVTVTVTAPVVERTYPCDGEFSAFEASLNYGAPMYTMVTVKIENDEVVSFYIDALQSKKNAAGTNYDWNAKSKKELGYLYGMHNTNNADAGYERQDLSTEEGLAAYQAYLTEQEKLEWFEQANMITAYALENGLEGLVMDEVTKKLDGSVEALAGVSVTVEHYLAVLEAVYADFPQA